LIWKVALGSIAALAVVISSAGYATAQEKSIVVASTTSTKDTGLFDHLLPLFTMKTGIAVKVLAVGTGQALDIARAAKLMLCLSITNQQNRHSSSKDTARNDIPSCTTTSC
jgi:ABC-type tungstate transport system permease subunit